MEERLLWAFALALLCIDLTSEAQHGFDPFLPLNSRSIDWHGQFDDGFDSKYIANETRFKRQATSCGPRKFTCDNGKCIDITIKCDGNKDCEDGSDETFKACKDTDCDSYLFRCNYGACVSGDAKCNKLVECADGSDEKYCDGTTAPPKTNKCGTNSYQCDNGNCIDRNLKCNGHADCSDGTDETFAVCGQIECEDYLFTCDYGACIDDDKRCNKVIDCVDESDENRSECPDSVPSTPKVTSTTPKTITRVTTTPFTIDPRKPGESGCTVPETPMDGSYTARKYNNIRRPGDVVPADFVLEIKCRSNYSVVGNSLIKCQDDGRWDPPVPECKKDCKPYELYSVDVTCEEKGVSVSCEERIKHNTIMTAVCKTYHQNNYLPRNICIDGNWVNSKPTCQPKCGEPTGVGVGLALGGKLTRRGMVPWHTVIYQTSNDDPSGYAQICGGTIISNLLVISAAHCFYDNNKKRTKDPGLYEVATSKFLRKYELEFGDDYPYTKRIPVDQIFIPQYYTGDATNEQADVAILKLSELMDFNQFVLPVCLNFENSFNSIQLKEGSFGMVAGMGLTSEGGKSSDELLHVELPWVNLAECREKVPSAFLKYLTLDKFCAGYLNATGVCSGDSGGGFVVESKGLNKWFLQGIVSTGVPSAIYGTQSCRNDSYATFTKIIEHGSWIAEHIQMFK